MAKTAKLKKSAISANPRSRSAKRASSPSIDIDKSLRDAPRASDATPVLGIQSNSGISKAKRKQKPMTKGQRRRQTRGFERAEVVRDQLEKKVVGAQSRDKRLKSRRALWEEVDNAVEKDAVKQTVPPVEVSGVSENDDWVDEEDGAEDGDDIDMKVADGVQTPFVAASTNPVAVESTTARIEPGDDIDQIT